MTGSQRTRAVITVPWARRQGGAEVMLWTFLQHIDRNRIEPLVVFFEPGPFERDVAGLGISTSVLPAGRLRQVQRFNRAVRALAGLLQRERPDVLMNWSAKMHLYGAPATALARVPIKVVWWQHGVTAGNWIDRAATALPSAAIGCSSRSSAQAQARLHPRRPIFVVYPGIDPPAQAPGEREAIRARLGIPADRFVAGIVARLQPDKGQHRVIEALGVLHRRGVSVHGLIVGGTAFGLSEEYLPRLRGLVERLGLTDFVSFAGQVADAGPYIEAMDVLINASEGESFGITLIEAMARGVPVIAPDAAGPSEIVESGRSGLLVQRPDPGLIACAVEELVAAPALRERLAAGGARRYRTLFSADTMSARLERHLLALAQR